MAEPTTYIVLRDMEGDWHEIGRFDSRSANGAVRAACDGYGSNDPSTYVAIPARSFKPVTVRAEQQVVLKLEDAG